LQSRLKAYILHLYAANTPDLAPPEESTLANPHGKKQRVRFDHSKLVEGATQLNLEVASELRQRHKQMAKRATMLSFKVSDENKRLFHFVLTYYEPLLDGLQKQNLTLMVGDGAVSIY
jgi:hypothetical protein